MVTGQGLGRGSQHERHGMPSAHPSAPIIPRLDGYCVCKMRERDHERDFAVGVALLGPGISANCVRRLVVFHVRRRHANGVVIGSPELDEACSVFADGQCTRSLPHDIAQ